VETTIGRKEHRAGEPVRDLVANRLLRQGRYGEGSPENEQSTGDFDTETRQVKPKYLRDEKVCLERH